MSVLSVMVPPEYGSASTGGEVRVFFKVSMARSSLLLSGADVFGWIFFSLWFSADTIRAKLDTNRLKTLQKPKKDLSSVRLRLPM